VLGFLDFIWIANLGWAEKMKKLGLDGLNKIFLLWHVLFIYFKNNKMYPCIGFFHKMSYRRIRIRRIPIHVPVSVPARCWQLLRGTVDLEDLRLSLVCTARRPLIIQKIVLKNFQQNWLNFAHVVLLMVVVLDLLSEKNFQQNWLNFAHIVLLVVVVLDLLSEAQWLLGCCYFICSCFIVILGS
jgi:hypothetical protein